MDIQTKDGITLRGIPDGTPDEAIKARIAKIRAGSSQEIDAETLANINASNPAIEASYRQPFSAPAQAPAQEPSDLDVGKNAANKAIAGIPDALLNTPNKVMNLGKAGFGTAATAMGRLDLAPEVTPDPNYAAKGMRALGMTSDEAEPANARQRVLDALVQGGVGMSINPAGSLRALVTNAIAGLTSGATAGLTKEATGSDELAQSAGMLTPLAVQAGAGYGRQKVADAKLRQSQNEVRDQTLADAKDEGYVVSPSSVNPSAVNKILESVAGKAATVQEASNRNQTVTSELAVRDLGLPKGTALTEGRLDAYRDRVSGPYREVVAISPRAEVALEQLKDARFNSNAYARHYDISADPKSLAASKALAAKADVLENQIEQMAVKAGKPDLVDDLRAARTQIAKSYDIQRALNIGDAGVSAPALGKALDRGKPLSGGLETAGRFAEAFPSVAREGSKIPAPGVSKVAAALASVLGVAGYGAMGPAGLLAGAVPLASGPVRSLILSKAYQDRMAKPDYSGGLSARALNQLEQMSPQQQAVQAALIARVLADQTQEGN